MRLIFEALNQTDAAFSQLKRQLKDTQGETEALHSKSRELDTGIGSLIARYLTLTAVIAGVTATAKSAISYLAGIETATLGIGAAFMVGGKYIDSTTGKALAAQDALKAATGDAKDIVAELQYANLQTIATLDELINAYQVTLPVALAKGFNRNQVKEFTVAMVQAAGAIGLQMNQLAEETRSLLTGAIDPRTSRIATVLGLRNEDINKFKGDANGLFNFLMEKLAAYKAAGVESQKTWAGLWSNTKDIVLQALGKAGEPLFEALKYELKSLADSIVTIDDKTKSIKWNPEFLSGVNTFRDGLRNVIAELYRMGMLADKFGGTMALLKGDLEMNDMFRKRYMASEKALQDLAMEGTGWKPVTPDIDKQMREAALKGKKLFDQTMVNIGNPDESTQQLLRYYREIGGGKKPGWQGNPLPDPMKGSEKAEIEKKALQATLENYKAEAAAAIEANKTYVTGRKLALEQGLIDQKTFLDEQARKEEESVNITIASLVKKEAAIVASYARQKSLLDKSDPVKSAGTAESEKKDLADVRGELARERSRLVQIQTQGKIDSIEYSKKLAAAEREGELAVMTEIARLELEANKLRVERGEMKGPEALRIELEWETKLAEKKRQNLLLDLAAATDDSQKRRIQAQIAVIDKGLADLGGKGLKTAEATRKAAEERRAVREAEIQSRLSELDIAEASGTPHQDTLEKRISLTKELIDIQERALRGMTKTGNETAWYAQLDKVNAARKAFAELQREITMKSPFGAIGLGLQDVANQAKDVGTQLYGSIKRAFDGMTDALTDFVMTGKLNFADLAKSIIRDLIKIQIQAAVTGPLASGAKSLLGLLGGLLGSVGGTGSYYDPALGTEVSGTQIPIHHGGGKVGGTPAFYRFVPSPDLIPRRHGGGLAPDERMVINKVGERYVTREQNDWLSAIARKMEGGGQGLTIHVPVSADVGSKQMISELRSEIEGTVVRVIKKHS